MKIVILLSMLSVAALALEIPHELFSWKQIEYIWPCSRARETAIENGKYIRKNNVILGMTLWKDKLFVITPRFRPGVASTLNYIKLSDVRGKTPKLCPYPNWESNTLPEQGSKIGGSQMVSAEGVQVDANDRLWVLDWGYQGLEPWAKRTYFTDPAILIFDLYNNKLIRRYDLQDVGIKETSRFNHMELDSTSCGDTMAYISDPFGFGLIVYSFRKNNSWRISHNFFGADPFIGYYDFDFIKFALSVGIYGIAMSDIQEDGYRTAYFHPIGSTKEFKVSTKVLMNSSYANSVDAYQEYQLVGERGPNTVSVSNILDRKGIMYFAMTPSYSVACWNTSLPLNPNNFKTVLKYEQVLYPYDVMIDDEDNLWILSSNIPKMQKDCVNPNEINHRILKLTSEEASRACENQILNPAHL